MVLLVAAVVAALFLSARYAYDTQEQDGIMLWVQRPPSGEHVAFLAEVGGTVVVQDPGCLMLQSESGSLPVVWPSGTQFVTTTPVVLVLNDGREVRAGDVVSAGGGFRGAGRRPFTSIPAECLSDTGQVAVFNPLERLRID